MCGNLCRRLGYVVHLDILRLLPRQISFYRPRVQQHQTSNEIKKNCTMQNFLLLSSAVNDIWNTCVHAHIVVIAVADLDGGPPSPFGRRTDDRPVCLHGERQKCRIWHCHIVRVFDNVKFCISVFLHPAGRISISLMRSRHHVVVCTFGHVS